MANDKNKRLNVDHPTRSFPYVIQRRVNRLSAPRRYVDCTSTLKMPKFTPRGIRVSALSGHTHAILTIKEISLPYVGKLIKLKEMYRRMFDKERLERLDRMIEASNSTRYSRLANCMVHLRKTYGSKKDKKKGWTASEWKKKMDYISRLASPRPQFEPDVVDRGPRKPLNELLPHLNQLCETPEHKVYKRLSQQNWYKDPKKIPRQALTYVISDHIKKLAQPRKEVASAS